MTDNPKMNDKVPVNEMAQASTRRDGFGTDGIGDNGDGSMGTADTSAGGTGATGHGGSQRGGHKVEGADREEEGGTPGRRNPANKQGPGGNIHSD